MKTIVALGTLREDITLNYDFSHPMKVPEVKVHKTKWSVGGSVHNTCRYLSLNSTNLNIRMCMANYVLLLQRVNQDAIADNYRIITTETELREYPISIIGVREDGDKQLLSYDPVTDTELLLLFEREAKKADFVYTSFYEINEYNFLRICKAMQECHSRGVMTMIDLCPLISSLSEGTLREVLNNVAIVSGNEHEYKDLIHKFGITDVDALMREYSNIEYLYIKRGNQGAEYKSRYEADDCKVRCLEFINSENLNTTGCGDVFNAVIIEGLCLREDKQSILKRAVLESEKIAKGGLPWIKK